MSESKQAIARIFEALNKRSHLVNVIPMKDVPGLESLDSEMLAKWLEPFELTYTIVGNDLHIRRVPDRDLRFFRMTDEVYKTDDFQPEQFDAFFSRMAVRVRELRMKASDSYLHESLVGCWPTFGYSAGRFNVCIPFPHVHYASNGVEAELISFAELLAEQVFGREANVRTSRQGSFSLELTIQLDGFQRPDTRKNAGGRSDRTGARKHSGPATSKLQVPDAIRKAVHENQVAAPQTVATTVEELVPQTHEDNAMPAEEASI